MGSLLFGFVPLPICKYAKKLLERNTSYRALFLEDSAVATFFWCYMNTSQSVPTCQSLEPFQSTHFAMNIRAQFLFLPFDPCLFDQRALNGIGDPLVSKTNFPSYLISLTPIHQSLKLKEPRATKYLHIYAFFHGSGLIHSTGVVE